MKWLTLVVELLRAVLTALEGARAPLVGATAAAAAGASVEAVLRPLAALFGLFLKLIQAMPSLGLF